MWECKCGNINPNNVNTCLKCKSSIALSNITRSSTSAANGNGSFNTHHDIYLNEEPIIGAILNNSGFYSEPPSYDSAPSYSSSSRSESNSSNSDSNSSSSYGSSSSSDSSSSSSD